MSVTDHVQITNDTMQVRDDAVACDIYVVACVMRVARAFF